jgi:trimeric autotransporter adhesin
MKKIISLATAILLLSVFSLNAQNVLVTGALAGNGSYPDLGAAFAAINGGAQTGATIVVSITGSTTEPVTAVLNAGTWNGLSILPTGGVGRTISGNIAGPLVNFNGADKVVVDGLNTGGNSLTIDNANNTTASTIQFINDAHLVSVQNCTVKGANTSAASGTIFFSTATVTGNDSITINACTINESGANFPTNGILSVGTPIAGQENSVILLNNCFVSNYFNAATVSVGIFAAIGNTDWTITNARLFQTAARTYTTANTHRGIQIISGNNHIVSNNVIGFSTSTFSGTYTMNSTLATRFVAIELSVGTVVASSVQGNTISNFLLTTSSGASTTFGILCGINVTSGNVNIGTIAPNTIGNTTGVNSLVANSTTSNGMVVGINSSSTGAIAINQNIIGALTSTGLTAAISGNVTGINISGNASSLTISTNVIGNTTADNMRGGTLGLTTGSSGVFGINLPSTPTGTISIISNTIRNMASYGTGTTGFVRGIMTSAASGNPNTYSIIGNDITNLVSNNSNANITNGQPGVCGICLGTGTNSIVSQNPISNLSNIGISVLQSYVVGITNANATNSTITKNQIYNLTNAGTSITTTAPSIIAGIVIRSGTTSVTVSNNMISLGTGVTNNNAIVGIMGNHGSTPDPTDNIYHNTINITGTVTAGAQPSIGIGRTDFSAIARTAPMDIRNNIVTNTRTGGTGVHCAIANNYGAVTSSATGWGVNASNNNVLNATVSSIGYWSSAPLTFANWQTTSASDANSYSGITVTYVNAATNLHLNMGVTPTVLESGGQTIATVLIDIDNQNRPGPTGSVNGGAFAPDLGADEFDGVYLDALAPTITYTPLVFTCATSDRTLTATIVDFTGVPTTGVLMPRIYFRKNANAYVSAPGVLTSGTGQNGTWTFTISTAAMGGLAIGDVVSYYVIAQDIVSPTFNITSNPAVGLVATNVNTVTTPPTTPNTYAIAGTLSGTYTVGTTGIFTTLTAAVTAYNTSCLSGAVTFSLIDATYPSETFPITVLANSNASAINTLTIKPTTATVISGSSATSIIAISGADFVTIDGSIGTTANTTCPRVTASRDLSFTNTNASTTSAVVSLQTTAAGNPATNNRVMNCIITGNGSLTTLALVNISGPTIGNGLGAANNSNNQIVNNQIQQGQIGIFSAGSSVALKNQNNTYSLNDMNSIGTAALGRVGIMILFEDAPIVHSNNIGNISNSTSQDVMGITLGSNAASNTLTTGSEVSNAIVENNTISSLTQTNTFSCIGILIGATATGTTNIKNNIVNRVFCNGTAGDFAAAFYYAGGAGTMNIYHNTLVVGGAVLIGASQPNIAVAINGSTPIVDLRNNVIACSGDNGFAGNTGIGLAYTSTLGNYANLTSNYNDVFVLGTSAVFSRVGGLVTGTTLPVLASWQTETGRDANSVSVLPVFVSTTDLHLVAGSNPLLEDMAAPLPAVPADIDCATRNTCAVDMGADEFGTPREADISGNSVAITDGDVTPSFGDFTSFDSSSVCNGSTTRTFDIVNNGTSSLTVSAVTISGANASDFIVTLSPVSPIASLATSFFTIMFDPSAAGLRTATVTVTTNDCNEASYDYAIEGIGTEITASLASQTNVDCNGATTGSATVDVVGGMPTITYSWSSGGTAATETNLAAGTYSVIVSDANTCSDTVFVTITENPAITNSFSGITNVNCNGGTTGQATSVAAGGTGTINYSWSSGGTAATETNLAAGTHTLTLTDSLACTLIDSVTITEPAAIISSVSSQTDVACNGSSSGSATVNSTGGSGTHAYSWSSGGTTATETGLAAGTYTVTITDSLSCSVTQLVTITEPAAIVPSIVSQTNVSCNGGSNGSATAGATGGSGSFTYSWSSGGTNATETGLGIGTYTVTMTDSLGCTASQTVSITAPAILNSISNLITNTSTCGGSDGAVDQLVTGGTPSYTFSWSNSAITEDISGLVAGTYSCLVTDSMGCTDSLIVVVGDPTPPVVTFSITQLVICEYDPNITLSGTPAGGTFAGPGVTGNTFDPSSLNGMTVITYSFTDPNTGCSASISDSIQVNICPGVVELGTGDGITVYPNPNSGLFTIALTANPTQAMQVEIINNLGQTVQAFTMNTNNKQVDLSAYESGVYMIRLIDGDKVTVKRIVIE